MYDTQSTSWGRLSRETPRRRLDGVEINFSGAGSADSAWRLSGRRLRLMDMIEAVSNDSGLGDGCDNAQASTAARALLNIPQGTFS